MITVRNPGDLFKAGGPTARGSFEGLWHFSFDMYHDPWNMHFGTLRVFNDDIISEGGEWGIHPHKHNEVLTYVMHGEFTHEDEHGEGGTMKKGAMQHTTVGTGMYHNEINASKSDKMRFIQMWFFPDTEGLKPSVSQYSPAKSERTNRLLLLASKDKKAPLRIRSDVSAYVSFLEDGKELSFDIQDGWGVYLANLEGGNLIVNDNTIPERGAAKIEGEKHITIKAVQDVELLLLEVSLNADYARP
ncbi:MAG: pirin family protein [Desulfobacterales bacterium]|nr:pirin family protein [Desulfobacterales bacterium]